MKGGQLVDCPLFLSSCFAAFVMSHWAWSCIIRLSSLRANTQAISQTTGGSYDTKLNYLPL
jgi:hypothetical protein